MSWERAIALPSKIIDRIFFVQARIIITSRIIGYEQQRNELENASFNTFLLENFTDTQINNFVAQCHDFAFTNLTDRELKCDRFSELQI